MANIPQSRVAGGGFWSQPKVEYSQQTHSLLKEMMQESKLTNFQQRHLEKTLRGGGSLPVQCPPTGSVKKKTPVSAPPRAKVLNPRNYRTTIRTKDQMEEMGAFEKPDYTPAPNTRGTSKEKEKQRLANIMEFGKDAPTRRKPKPQPVKEAPPIDRFDELQAEIAERKNFLSEMESLGQGDKYRTVIETEISQLIREMELIDKKRSKELDRLLEEDRKKRGVEL